MGADVSDAETLEAEKAADIFDRLRVIFPIHIIDGLRSTCHVARETKNLLYYAHYYRYKYGHLLRAILGRDEVYDLDWEMEIINTLDLLLQRPEHSCQVFRYRGIRQVEIQGRLWKYNDWARGVTYSAKALKHMPPMKLVVNPMERVLIYARSHGEYVDLEGPILLSDGSRKNGVLTLYRSTWEKRHKGLFREVRLKDDKPEAALYVPIPDIRAWRREHVAENQNAADLLPAVPKTNRDGSLKEDTESMLSVSSYVSRRLVSKPWRILENFRGTTVEDYYRQHGSVYVRKSDPRNLSPYRKKRAHPSENSDTLFRDYFEPAKNPSVDEAIREEESLGESET